MIMSSLRESEIENVENGPMNDEGTSRRRCGPSMVVRPDKFGNQRCRRDDTEISYPSMRDVLRKRLYNKFGQSKKTDGYLKWLWPAQKAKRRGDYPRDDRYTVFARDDLNGIPRFAVNHYLKEGCQQGAITSLLPGVFEENRWV